MSTTVNRGNQVLLYSYKQEVTSEGFNQLNHRLHPHGIYSGGTISKLDDNNVRVEPLLCVFEVPENKATVRIETNSVIDQFVTQFNNFVVLRFTWNNTELNFMDVRSVSEIDILPLDLIICKCIYVGGMLVDFDYSRKSWSYNYYNKISNYNPPFKVIANEPYDQQITVLPGGPYIFNGSVLQILQETLSPEFVFPVPIEGRTDVVCLDKDSNINIITGSSLSLPLIKTEYFPIAIITFPPNTTVSVVRGTYIDYLHPNQFLSSEIHTSEISTPNTYVKRTIDGDIQARRFISDVPTGLSPFTVLSTTKVVNLNTDLFDDLDSTDFVRTTGTVTQSITGNKSFSGSTTFTGTVAVNNQTLSTNQTTFNLINTTATTVNFAGVATSLTIGAASGTATLRNSTINFPNCTSLTVGVNDSTVQNINFLGQGFFIVGHATNKKVSTFNGDVGVNGTLTINGNIIQNGSSYETHAEKLYTTKDLIITRDGATLALGPGEISGLQVLKYDGTNNLIFGTDVDGYFKVGEVGSLQILATREDTLANNSIPYWDDTAKQFKDSTATISGNVITGNVTGYSGSVKSPSTTGVVRFTGMAASTTRDKTIRDANDTILELAGSYTPTGTWTSLKLNEDVALTTTSTKLNYLTSATGTTGINSTNVVFSTNPQITGLRLVQGTFYVEINPTTLVANRTLTLPDGNVTLVSGTMVPDSRTLTIANGTGITGGSAAVDLSANRSWTIGLTGLALALHNVSATDGIIAKTGAATVAARTITGTANRISITNGGGAGGNPTIDIASTYVGQTSITTLGTISTGSIPWSLISNIPNYAGSSSAGGTATTIAVTTTFGSTYPILVHVSNSAYSVPSVTITGSTGTITAPFFSGTLIIPTNGSINDVNGNELIKFPTAVTSAVNELYISNSTTGNAVTLSTTGNDTNIGLTLSTKGAGAIVLDTGTGAGQIDLKPGSSNVRIWDDDSSHYFQFATGNISANYTITLPAASGTLAYTNASTFTSLININSSTTTSTTNIAYGAIASGVVKSINIGGAGVSGSATYIDLGSSISGATGVITAHHLLTTRTSTTASAPFRIPHGTAPTSPAHGDIWTTTSGMFACINGVTVGPFGSGTGTGTVTSVAAGNGMNFTTITTTGSVTLGTPSSCSNGTSNAVTANSHTHTITGFLPLTGGTLTGTLILHSGTSTTARSIWIT